MLILNRVICARNAKEISLYCELQADFFYVPLEQKQLREVRTLPKIRLYR